MSITRGPSERKRRVAFSAGPRYPALMDRLTAEQAQKIHDALGPALGYLARLPTHTGGVSSAGRSTCRAIAASTRAFRPTSASVPVPGWVPSHSPGGKSPTPIPLPGRLRLIIRQQLLRLPDREAGRPKGHH